LSDSFYRLRPPSPTTPRSERVTAPVTERVMLPAMFTATLRITRCVVGFEKNCSKAPGPLGAAVSGIGYGGALAEDCCGWPSASESSELMAGGAAAAEGVES